MIHRMFLLLGTYLFSCLTVYAESRVAVLNPDKDPRGDAELTVCSQNLENYGSFADSRSKNPKLSENDFLEQENNLVRRFAQVGCDVVAVQELLGVSEVAAKKALDQLALQLRQKSGRVYDAVVGPISEGMLTLGYLVAKDRADVANTVSYDRVELPKLSAKQKPRLFTRGPLELQLNVKGKGDSTNKLVTLVNIHFKSKRSGQGDPAGLDWETWRMEMAEALRRIVEKRHSQSFTARDQILIVLGDRNSHHDVSSAKILDGTLTLKAFQGESPCRMNKRGAPFCKAGIATPQKLFSVLLGDPQTKLLPGTFKYKKEYSWLDDILLPQEMLPFAWASALKEGDYDSGVVYEPKGSDHAMVYVRLNW